MARALDPAKPSAFSVSIAASTSWARVAAEREESLLTTRLTVPDLAICHPSV